MLKAMTLAATAALLLMACSGSSNERRPAAGANSGVVFGSEVGAGSGEAPLGAVEGGLLGADIGRSLDDADRRIAGQAEYEALEYGRAGRPATWNSPGSGNRGEVVVGPAYEVNRLDCRQYSHRVFIGGRPRVAKGTACREPDSTWRIIG